MDRDAVILGPLFHHNFEADVVPNIRQYVIPAFPPSCLADPTGCGDTYMAAFIFASGFPWNLDEIGRFAAMAATTKLECQGPLRATSSQVLQRLQ